MKSLDIIDIIMSVMSTFYSTFSRRVIIIIILKNILLLYYIICPQKNYMMKIRVDKQCLKF